MAWRFPGLQQRKLGAWALLLLGPVAASAVCAHYGLRFGEVYGQRLGQLVAASRAQAATATPLEDTLADSAALPEAEPSQADAPERLSRAKGTAPSRRRPSAATHGLMVSAAQVLAIAQRGVQPSAASVPARGDRPAGLMLQNVGALGVGLRDGDILTEVAGRPVRAPSEVIGMVIAARAKHAASISGRFWRAGEVWQLVVQQPYPERG